MNIRSIQHIDLIKGKTILVRVDFNVPFKGRKVIDNTKIIASIPTIKYLSDKGARVILVSHLGRPEKQKKKTHNKEIFNFNKDNNFTLKIVIKELDKGLNKKVNFFSECLGKKIQAKVSKMDDGDIALLENIRFYEEEEKNDINLARELASLADVYVNEAFAASHREHSSVSAIQEFLPVFYGFLFEQEILHLDKVIKKPIKPYTVLLGGSKLSTKIKLIKNLEKKANKILIGGAMANVFLKASNYEVGKSLVEKESIKLAKQLLKNNKKIILPKDVLVAKKIDENSMVNIRKIKDIKKNEIILDLGPETILEYSRILKKSKTILWNGPLGKTEIKQFSTGSVALARVVAAVSKGRAFGVCGGGETIDVLNRTDMSEFMDWVSTGGGAMLTYLSGDEMPGISKKVISKKNIMNLKKPVIVLVDDKNISKKILDSDIIQDKFEVIHASSGKEAIKLIIKNKPDLVISGVVVRGGDLFYIMDEMNDNKNIKHIPVIALTALSSKEDERELKKVGVKDYILKPECSDKDLLKKINSILKK